MFGTFSGNPNDDAWRRTPPASAETVLAEIRASHSDAEKKKIQSLFAEYTRIGNELQQYCPDAIKKSNECEAAALANPKLSPEQTADVVLNQRKFRDSAPVFEQKLKLQLYDARRKLFPACSKILKSLVAAIDKELAAAPTLGATTTRWGLSATEELARAIEYPLLRLKSMAEWDLEAIYEPGRAGDDYVVGSFTPDQLLGDLA